MSEAVRIPTVLHFYAVTSDQWGLTNGTVIERGVDAMFTTKQCARMLPEAFSFH